MINQLQEQHHHELDRVISSLRDRAQAGPAGLMDAAFNVIARVEHVQQAHVDDAEARLLAARLADWFGHVATWMESVKPNLTQEHDGMLGLDAALAT